ncbi:hypothetical protein BG842_21370 [Haladaptatus sp. W1]|uniref:DUF7575 domain-containing protein n=1 Tax=Haladaptatus sp. W1 TaxID=1897478 RepID=UPI00084998D0|nr:hypothetical protein [Haladaptatus sp. W1]ODR82503.1 hypothetical protein BG842_21370 [Haladaptatus sp. W1]
MGYGHSQKRPWLAVVLGVVVTGLGHAYLGRWRRAVAWLSVDLGVATFVTPEATLQALATGAQFPTAELVPIFAVTSISIADAYLLAHRAGSNSPSDGESETERACPHCGRSAEPELEFCQWCSTRLDKSDARAESESEA